LLTLKDGNKKYGGSFTDELDAAKRVNQLCEELGIPEKNPGIGTIPNRQCEIKKKTSQYKGVVLHEKSRKWHVLLTLKDGNKKYGGSFTDELDAAKRVNQLCEKLGIPEKNPKIGMPHRQWQPQKKSKYEGVSWNSNRRKWYVTVRLKDGNKKFGGSFTDELDAAKKVNQLCKENGLPMKNPEINKKLNYNPGNDSEGATSAMDSEIVITEDLKEKKRKRIKNKFPFEQYYFYDEMLKK